MPWLHWIERFPPNSLSRSILFFTLAGALFGAKLPSVDSIFNSLIDAKSPGAAVLIRQRGRTVVMRGYGVTDLRTFGKIDAHTNFRLASCTKQFTAMAVMLLVHDGKLRYEENLTEIFPGFPAYGRAVTVRHLLTHTSGLSDYETLMEQQQKAGGAAWSATKQIHDEDVLALLAQQDHGDFAPGTSWAYSNSGYVVLGLIVAKVAGMPYAEFLQRRIFKPLKMSRTVAYVRGQNIVRHRAYGYSKNDGRFQESAKGAAARRQTAEEIPSSLGGAADPAPVLREFEDTDQSATSATPWRWRSLFQPAGLGALG